MMKRRDFLKGLFIVPVLSSAEHDKKITNTGKEDLRVGSMTSLKKGESYEWDFGSIRVT